MLRFELLTKFSNVYISYVTKVKFGLMLCFVDVDGFAQDALQINCFDIFEKYSNEIKTVFFSVAVVHNSIRFVVIFVLK